LEGGVPTKPSSRQLVGSIGKADFLLDWFYMLKKQIWLGKPSNIGVELSGVSKFLACGARKDLKGLRLALGNLSFYMEEVMENKWRQATGDEKVSCAPRKERLAFERSRSMKERLCSHRGWRERHPDKKARLGVANAEREPSRYGFS